MCLHAPHTKVQGKVKYIKKKKNPQYNVFLKQLMHYGIKYKKQS